MRVKYKGRTVFPCLTTNKIYDVISIEKKWYRVIDDSGEDYIYAPEQFEVMDDDNDGVIVIDNTISNEEAKKNMKKVKKIVNGLKENNVN